MQTFCQTKLQLTIVDPFSVAKVSLSEQSIYTTAHCTFILPAEKKKKKKIGNGNNARVCLAK